MLPAARQQAAIDVLDAWLEGPSLDQALSRWSRGARYAGSKDRRAVRDIVFDVLRNRGRARALGTSVVRTESGRALVFGWLRLRGSDLGAVFTGLGHAPAPLNAEERRLLGERPNAPITLDTPDWLLSLLRAEYGADTEPLLGAFSHRAPLYVRVNSDAATAAERVAKARVALAGDGIASEPVEGAATALKITEQGARLAQSTAYLQGMVEPQDLSVQLACSAVEWGAAQTLLDYCAGGGGKALAVAAATGRAVHVYDAEPRRMADLPARAARAKAELVEWRAGATGPDRFDCVLCDVPCSGSGTWRRDPEARWRLTLDRLRRLTEAQDAILDSAARRVGQGGRLIYMTCSLLQQENLDRIQAFLDRHKAACLVQSQAWNPLTASDGFFLAEIKL